MESTPKTKKMLNKNKPTPQTSLNSREARKENGLLVAMLSVSFRPQKWEGKGMGREWEGGREGEGEGKEREGMDISNGLLVATLASKSTNCLR